MNNYQLPEGVFDLQIHHISPHDKSADLPLKIYNHDKSKAALIPTFKNVMITTFPHFFKIFDKNQNNNNNNTIFAEPIFAESNHQNGEIYEITVPKLKDPKNLADFFRCVILGTELETVSTKSEEELIDYFWSAKYFQHDQMIEKLVERARANFDLKLLHVLGLHGKVEGKNFDGMCRQTVAAKFTDVFSHIFNQNDNDNDSLF